MSTKGMNRRRFLQTSSLALASAAVVGSMGAILPDPTNAWAMSTTTLDAHTALTLVKLCRAIYPHDALGDTYYAKIVEELDKKAQPDPDFARLLQEGVWLDALVETALAAEPLPHAGFTHPLSRETVQKASGARGDDEDGHSRCYRCFGPRLRVPPPLRGAGS